MRGGVIQRGDPGYDDARKLYNAMIDKRPSAIARCADVADVIACVNYAREKELVLAIRGGGHNGPGLGSCDDGLVIDLSSMRTIQVDAASRSAQIGGGCVWGEVDRATHAFGLATPSGIISSTGVGGLTLGGGIGHLSRKYGLTIDNLLSVDMVLADGRIVTANNNQNQDLFWAVRGGGGNFGIVVSFTFQLHPVDTVLAGPMFWDIKDAPAVMSAYEQFIADAPEEVNGFYAFITVPPVAMFPADLHMQKVCAVFWCSLAGEGRTREILKKAELWAKPLLSGVGPLPFPTWQNMFDSLYPPGLQWYWKADFVDHLGEEAINLHIQHGSQLPTLHSTMHLYPVNGAVHSKAEGDTAFSFRKTKWIEVIVGVDPDPANKGKITHWAKTYWEALHPFSAQGAYVNFMMEEGAARVESTYGGNYARLRQIKTKYDPSNLFRVNQNIAPVDSSG
jgi:UDP-N-acetylenolpyruvoylglucosamine reductase